MLKEMPLISVIVPVYGTEKYLRKCLDSLLEQTYKNIELIIVNDATKDDSEEIIKEYIMKYNNIKYVRHKKNKGLFQARVSGAEEATGDYIAFVDSDDYISQDFYRLLIRKSINKNCDMVVCNTVFEEIDGTRNIRPLYQLCFEKDELSAEEIKEKFFSQTGFCFSWHTVWNKIYSKELWDKCYEYYKKMNEHLIMTEDIAFSTLLLYNTEKLALEYHANYFYCKHPEASTNADGIRFSKFEKNMKDLKLAFDFVENFMTAENSDEKEKEYFSDFRKKYSRMYRSLQEYAFKDDKKAKKLVDNFIPGYRKKQREDEFCFDTVTAPFHDGLEYAKLAILDDTVKVVSFDIFDTLVVRPFYYPTDIFDLMSSRFDEITENKYNISFKKLRQDSEMYARKDLHIKSNGEDVTLSEIYDAMEHYYNIDHSVAEKMKNLENEYELRFCTVRKTGKELYDFAVDAGKEVIITSDMYLEEDVVSKILEKNGYNKHEYLFLSSKERALKTTGSLFKKVINTLKRKPESIIHIGDTWTSDITAAQNQKIKTFFLPKTRETFENIIGGIKTNNSAWTEKFISGSFSSPESARKSLGYRTMLAVVANKFFDNPFVSFNGKSDFNGDPRFIGYYALGMHCLGIARWIDSISDMCDYKDIYFLARDGYMPMKIFDIYNKWCNGSRKSHYLHASRSLTLPLMISDKNDLYDLPVEPVCHTPLSICRMISFCLSMDSEDEIKEKLINERFNIDKTFTDRNSFIKFIKFVSDNWFDENKLEKNRNVLKAYYSQISDKAVLFDMGYSGRIQNAICEAAERPIDAFYIHTDNSNSFAFSRKNKFRIHSFYNSMPASSDILREYLLSDIKPACKSIVQSDEGFTEIFEESKVEYPERFVVTTLQNAALEFISDFTEIFDGLSDDICFVPQEVSMPFEYFLRFAKKEDRKVLSLCVFEDKCYGNIVKVKADEFFNNALCDIKPYTEPADFEPLNKVQMKIVKADDVLNDDDYEEVNEQNSDSKTKTSKFPIMFNDAIDDSCKDNKEKFERCCNNTNNLVEWDSVIKTVSPKIISNWYMTNPLNFEKDGSEIFVTTALSCVRENEDISYLSKVLENIGDSTLLPVGIGFSTENENSSFELDEKSVKTIAEIAERCKSIGVHGEYSAELLNSFGIKNISIIGDPALYCDIDNMKKINNENKEINKVSASFKPFYGEFSNKENELLSYFAENRFDLTDCTPLSLNDSNIDDEKILEKLTKYEKKKKLFFDVSKWQSDFKNADFAIGMNFFNNVMAVRSGVKALFINYETSFREICRFFGLPCIEVKQFDSKLSIDEYFKSADYSGFLKEIDRKRNNYISFLKANGIEINDIDSCIIEK